MDSRKINSDKCAEQQALCRRVIIGKDISPIWTDWKCCCRTVGNQSFVRDICLMDWLSYRNNSTRCDSITVDCHLRQCLPIAGNSNFTYIRIPNERQRKNKSFHFGWVAAHCGWFFLVRVWKSFPLGSNWMDRTKKKPYRQVEGCWNMGQKYTVKYWFQTIRTNWFEYKMSASVCRHWRLSITSKLIYLSITRALSPLASA